MLDRVGNGADNGADNGKGQRTHATGQLYPHG
jgi:hypothetical protein